MNIVDLVNFYSGSSCFLVCGGPSLERLDLTLLDERGIISMGINNVTAGTYRTQLWVCGDNIKKFCVNIFKDPGIIKFVPEGVGNILRDGTPLGKMPSVVRYMRGYKFDHTKWLSESVCTWGNDKNTRGTDEVSGKRSTMLAALKILYMLGFREVYIIGADFKMDRSKPYVFNETKNPGGVSYNNQLYKVLNKRFELLQPEFLKQNFKVYNCTVGSNLAVFPRVGYVQSIARCMEKMPERINTYNMYQLPHIVSRKDKQPPIPTIVNGKSGRKTTQRVYKR